MAATDSWAYSAIATQLVAALDEYALAVRRMVSRPADAITYSLASQQIDILRMYAISLPEVSVQWSEVLVRHFELAQCAWQIRSGRPCGEALLEIYEQQQAAMESLRRKGMSMVRLH